MGSADDPRGAPRSLEAPSPPAPSSLRELVRILRSDPGCPWDRAQTWESLRPSLIEEAFEVDEALSRADDGAVREELGDLLFVLTLLTGMAEERGAFDLADVERGALDKLVRRHPHVFGDAEPGGLAGWEAIKAAERAARGAGVPPSALDGVPRAMPALLRAAAIGRKARAVGFDWPDLSGPRAKIHEELQELDEAVIRAQGSHDAAALGAVEEELGDVLFSVVNVARHLGLSPEAALHRATDKFEARFRTLEAGVRADGGDTRSMDAVALDARWTQAKS